MEPFLESMIKVLSYCAGPIIGLFAWLGKRLHNRIDSLEQEQKENKIEITILKTQQLDIKEDIQKMDEKLDKILDRV